MLVIFDIVLTFYVVTIVDLDDFPPVVPVGGESPTEKRPSSRKSQEYSHETEIIFALPTLEMHLKTEHRQKEQEPSEDGKMKNHINVNLKSSWDNLFSIHYVCPFYLQINTLNQ